MSTCECFCSCPFSFNFLLLDLFLKFHGPDSVGHVFLGKFPTWEVLWSFVYDNNGGSYKNGIKTINTLILCMTLNGHWLAFVSPPGINCMYVRPKFFRVMLSFTKDNKWLGFLWVAIVLASNLFIPKCSYWYVPLLVNDQIALKQPGVRRETSLHPTLHAVYLTRKRIHLLLFLNRKVL